MKRIFTPAFLSFFWFFAGYPAPALAQITLNPIPSRVLGQNSVQVTGFTPNLVEGRELFTPQGIALDTSSNPPALYVSDFGNNRVLGFRSATGFANGQAADVVLGQSDFATTFPQHSTGLTAPTGVAVDSQGNVYVADSGNNRVLRFPKPFAQTGVRAPDMAIGQASFDTTAANQDGISASTLALAGSSGALQAFLTFDTAGNLWVSDSGNNRVLRFNASVLGGQATSGPAADIVLGQTDFISNGYNPPGNPLTSVSAFTTPSGIAFDSAGRLFVMESTAGRRGRILAWSPPFSTGQVASRLLAVDTDNPQPPPVSELQLAQAPGGLFAIGDAIGAVDTVNSRILVYPPVEQWTPNSTHQAAIEVAGQPDFSSAGTSCGALATAAQFSCPAAAVFFGSELYVTDTFNNRIVVVPQKGGAFGPATRVLGQDQMNLNAPNLVEGREFNFGSSSLDAGLAIDLTSSPPRLYVADPYNNRVLGYGDIRSFKAGQKADIVIGQADFQQVMVNYPANDANQTNASGLYLPTGLVLDPDGNLYVADRGNGRVLRFPKPFANYTPGTPQQADLVIGQSNFTAARITDPTARTMSQPYGLAFTLAGGLLVSDIALNRVLYFPGRPADLKSGMSATIVYGQPDFNSSGSGAGLAQMKLPHHISSDLDDRLYVADSGNGRVLIFDHAPTLSPGQPAAQALTAGLKTPYGVYISPYSGEIWVSDASAGAAIRYPGFNLLNAAGGASNGGVSDPVGPLAVVEDGWGNLYLADAAHRVAIYYPGLGAINAANFLNQQILAPGMIGALFTQGNTNQFGSNATQATALPLPTQLNGIQVLFNGAPVPLFYAGPGQINFQVPTGAPESGTFDLQVVEVATGRVLGDTTVAMTSLLPGFFSINGDGIGAAAALNEDNTPNSQTNPAKQGSIIQLFGTGQGVIPGGPSDGNISNAALTSPAPIAVIMGTGPIPAANIKYSGLAPTLVGVWQVNLLIPDSVITTPSFATQVVAILQAADGTTIASGGGGAGRPIQIYVKQK